MGALPSNESLQCFVEAARLLSFRAAARAVGLTPAALGQRIRQLEDQIGTRLFHRTTRSVVLTSAGLDLVPVARRTLDEARACLTVGSGGASSAPMDVVLGTRHELGMSWVVPLHARLAAVRGGLTVHLYFGSGEDLVLRVRTLAIDCAVTSTRLTDPKLDFERLHEERYAFVASPKLLARQPFARTDHAADHALIDVSEELPLFRYWRDAPGGVDSLRFARIVRVGTIAGIREFVLREAGVAVLPEYFVAPDLARGRLVRVLERVTPLTDHFRLVFRADDPRRSVYEAMAETMRAHPLR